MSLLRIIGYFGLALLLLIVLFAIYLSTSKHDWQGIAIGLGGLVFLAFLGNGLWHQGFQQKYPTVNVAPNKTISALVFLVLGISTATASVEMLISSNWLSAVIALVMAVCLFEMAYDLFKKA